MIWRAATSMLYDNPLLGIGIGRFQTMYLAYQEYFPLYLEWAVPQPHNLYLALWLETGLVGLAGFIFLVSVWLKKMLILWRSSVQDEYIKKTSALFIALMALFLFLGLTDTPFFKTDLAFIFWFILALGVGFLNQRSMR
jgi:O-antigen ligase